MSSAFTCGALMSECARVFLCMLGCMCIHGGVSVCVKARGTQSFLCAALSGINGHSSMFLNRRERMTIERLNTSHFIAVSSEYDDQKNSVQFDVMWEKEGRARFIQRKDKGSN